MTHAIISLLSIAIILAGTLALAGTSCSAVDLVFSSWQGMAESTGQMARTRISRPADDDDVGTQGSHVKVVLENTGQAGVADFSRWDIIVQYYGTDNSYYIKRLPYSAGPPGDNQWAMTGIFQDTQTLKPDVFRAGHPQHRGANVASP